VVVGSGELGGVGSLGGAEMELPETLRELEGLGVGRLRSGALLSLGLGGVYVGLVDRSGRSVCEECNYLFINLSVNHGSCMTSLVL
jgi:hypothetical protein